MQTKSKNMNIRITEEEYKEIKSFADFMGTSVSSLMLKAVREQIENWEDVRDAKQALKDLEKGKSTTTDWEEVQRELNLL